MARTLSLQLKLEVPPPRGGVPGCLRLSTFTGTVQTLQLGPIYLSGLILGLGRVA